MVDGPIQFRDEDRNELLFYPGSIITTTNERPRELLCCLGGYNTTTSHTAATATDILPSES
jgi:hypothetical protein